MKTLNPHSPQFTEALAIETEHRWLRRNRALVYIMGTDG